MGSTFLQFAANSNEDLDELARCIDVQTKLQSLVLAVEQLDKEGLTKLVSALGIRPLKNLKLSIGACEFSEGNNLLVALSNIPSLEKLNLNIEDFECHSAQDLRDKTEEIRNAYQTHKVGAVQSMLDATQQDLAEAYHYAYEQTGNLFGYVSSMARAYNPLQQLSSMQMPSLPAMSCFPGQCMPSQMEELSFSSCMPPAKKKME